MNGFVRTLFTGQAAKSVKQQMESEVKFMNS